MTRLRPAFVFSIILIVLAGYIHYQAGTDVSMMLLYALPVLVSSWRIGKKEGFVIAASAGAIWLIVSLIHKTPGESDAILSWNAFSRFGIFCLIAYAVALQAKLRGALERERLRADTDRLTGLLNKGAFRERVEEEINRSKRYRRPLTLAFLDLDNFKLVNDVQGHARGDLLLQLVSETIVTTIRKTDLAGRIGGDEFTICFPETGQEQARTAIDNLVKAFNIMTSQSGWQITASIGVVTCLEVSENYDSLLGKADRLMYVAKQKGKNNAEFIIM